MFERYGSDALTTGPYFGRLVENLDADEVLLSAWKGEVALNDYNKSISMHSTRSWDRIVLSKFCMAKLQTWEWKTERSPLRWSYETPTTTNLVCFIILLDLHFLFTTRRTKETSDTADKLSMEE